MSALARDEARPLQARFGGRIEVIQVATAAERGAVLEIRRRVFGDEQGAVQLQVSDPDDSRSVIALALLHRDRQRQPVGTGRLTLAYGPHRQALVAWVATLPEARNHGVGRAVMRFLLDAADAAGVSETVLAAQAPAEHFYQRLGFQLAGPRYDVRGIPHRRMVRAFPG
jgi:ElaA protein